jgi:hypothetical protein
MAEDTTNTNGAQNERGQSFWELIRNTFGQSFSTRTSGTALSLSNIIVGRRSSGIDGTLLLAPES